jgi:hypothetical protein
MSVDRSKLEFYSGDSADKILDVYSGSFTVSAAPDEFDPYRAEYPISHDFGEAVFTDITWSQDGGDTWNGMANGVPNLSNPAQPKFQTCRVGCYSTSTKIVVTASNYTTSSQTILFNVVAIAKN